jgi:chromate transporter
MSIYGQIFWIFLKIGAFTIGGGYAMVPLIYREVVERKRWFTASEFSGLLAVSQSVPGILAVNIAIFTGYRMKKITGSLLATAGAILPSFLIILLIATFFRNFQDNPYIAKILKAVRPAVVALIAVAVFTTARSAGITRRTVGIPVAAALLIWYGGVSPIYIVLAAALAGVGFGFWDRRKKLKHK